MGGARGDRDGGLRLLRFLAVGSGARLADGAPEPKSGHDIIRLARSDGRSIAVGRTPFGAARRGGLIALSGADILLTEDGRRHLKRRLAALEGPVPDQPFLGQAKELKRESIDVDGAMRMVVVDGDESPLSGLRRLKRKDGRPFLEDDAYVAGERLRRDFTRGRLQPRITSNWQAGVAQGARSGGNGIADLTDASLAARQRVDRALRFVGPELSGVLLDICCYLKGLELVERERLWPPRSAKLMLRTGLEMLSRHYGYRR